MLTEIPKENWKVFCDEISRDRLDWEISVKVLSSDYGAQVLSAGLPLIGLTFETENGKEKIELVTGTRASIHQTHSIFDPTKLLLEQDGGTDGGTLDIEDDEGTKTLINFVRPSTLPTPYENRSMMKWH